jgi:hypothetical protein
MWLEGSVTKAETANFGALSGVEFRREIGGRQEKMLGEKAAERYSLRASE